MAIGNFLDPYSTPAMNAGPTDLRGRWDQFFQNPDNRQALLQFGAAMLQPIAPGQTLLGQIGQGIAAAVAGKAQAEDRRLRRDQMAFDRNLAIQGLALRREDFESDKDYREAQQEFQRQQAEVAQSNAEADRGLKERSVATDERTAAASIAKANADTRGQLTPAKILDLKRKIAENYTWYELTNQGDPNKMTLDQYTQQALTSMGIPPEQANFGPEDFGPREIVPLAGPAVPPAVAPTSPMSSPSAATPATVTQRMNVQGGDVPQREQLTSEQVKTAQGGKVFRVLQARLSSPDPQIRAKALLTLQKIKMNMVDPENLGL